jgi:hypothetical protein
MGTGILFVDASGAQTDPHTLPGPTLPKQLNIPTLLHSKAAAAVNELDRIHCRA